MKRYNIHLDPEWMDAIDKIRDKIISENKDIWHLRSLTRSDLIRFAVGRFFDLGEGVAHYWGSDIEKITVRALMKRKRR